MNIVTQFSPNNTIRGYYNITWTPPAPTNGSFYQTLNYSYSSAYSVGPTYDGAFNITLNQSQDYFIFEALYYTDYSFNITTSNMKYAIDNGPARFSNQSSPTGIHIITVLSTMCNVRYYILQHLQLFVILELQCLHLYQFTLPGIIQNIRTASY